MSIIVHNILLQKKHNFGQSSLFGLERWKGRELRVKNEERKNKIKI